MFRFVASIALALFVVSCDDTPLQPRELQQPHQLEWVNVQVPRLTSTFTASVPAPVMGFGRLAVIRAAAAGALSVPVKVAAAVDGQPVASLTVDLKPTVYETIVDDAAVFGGIDSVTLTTTPGAPAGVLVISLGFVQEVAP